MMSSFSKVPHSIWRQEETSALCLRILAKFLVRFTSSGLILTHSKRVLILSYIYIFLCSAFKSLRSALTTKKKQEVRPDKAFQVGEKDAKQTDKVQRYYKDKVT